MQPGPWAARVTRSALPALRDAAQSPYKSIQVHAIRSLGALNDTESAPVLLKRIQSERDAGLQIACASSLGRLGVADAIDPILALMARIDESRRTA